MSATYVQAEGLKELLKTLEQTAEALPVEKRAMYRRVGDELLAALQRRIGGTGKVQNWQERYVGSGGGYAAVRPAAKRYTRDGYPVGYVTNALENGHIQHKGQFVPALGKQLARERVPGKQYYAETRTDADRIAVKAAEEFLRELQRKLRE